jgi:hypothetical protein
MCIDSEASGQTVYIDTKKAKATDNSSGPLCICDATISNAKFVNVSVQENIATCGSKLKFDFTNKQVESDENKCRSTKELVQIENQQEVRLSLEKIKTPYSVDFCTKIEIGKKISIVRFIYYFRYAPKFEHSISKRAFKHSCLLLQACHLKDVLK